MTATCEACDGTGLVQGSVCPVCEGAGKVRLVYVPLAATEGNQAEVPWEYRERSVYRVDVLQKELRTIFASRKEDKP